MIQQTEVQAAYNNLYAQIAKYIWPYGTIELLADLEISVYTAFPDLGKIRRIYSSLKIDLVRAAEKDEDLQEVMTAFDDIIKDQDEVFIKIPVPMEVEEE